MKAKKTGKWVFFVIFALILALTYTAVFGIDSYYGDTRNIYFKGANKQDADYNGEIRFFACWNDFEIENGKNTSYM